MARRRKRKGNPDVIAFETVGIGIVLVAIAAYVYMRAKNSSAVTPSAPVGNTSATGKLLDTLGIGTSADARALASNDPIGASLASGGI